MYYDDLFKLYRKITLPCSYFSNIKFFILKLCSIIYLLSTLIYNIYTFNNMSEQQPLIYRVILFSVGFMYNLYSLY